MNNSHSIGSKVHESPGEAHAASDQQRGDAAHAAGVQLGRDHSRVKHPHRAGSAGGGGNTAPLGGNSAPLGGNSAPLGGKSAPLGGNTATLGGNSARHQHGTSRERNQEAHRSAGGAAGDQNTAYQATVSESGY